MTIQQPPLIKYNLKDRGRQFTGADRNFDVSAIVKAINSPACQERIKKRDMLGFLGHWIRIRFGLEPVEGGVHNGKIKTIEPAIITTGLKAYPNGDIEHQTEFLDNPSGHIAYRMYKNKIGGFSSVIDEIKNVFWGFDWVNEPNYSTNRGYALTMDSVSNGSITYDDIIAGELYERTQYMNALLEASELREGIALDSANRLVAENEQLMDLMNKMNEDTRPDKMVRDNFRHTSLFVNDQIAFDSVHTLPFFKEENQEERTDQAKAEVIVNDVLVGLNIHV